MATNSSSSETTVVGGGGAGGRKEIMLFGVRVVVDPMRKSVSLNNLSEYEQPEEILKQIGGGGGGGDGYGEEKNKADTAAAGYASADDAVPMSSSGGNRERKRGIPWTEEEHKLFLLGLQKVGKGDWKGISRNFVKTRTPTQVASHAQKYFIRRSNLNRRRRRSSLFDMTTETVTGMAMGEDQVHAQENTSGSRPSPLVPENNGSSEHLAMQVFPTVGAPMENGNPLENSGLGQPPYPKNSPSNLVHLVPVTFHSSPAFGLNIYENSTVDPSSLSLNLSLASTNPKASSSANHLGFKAIPNSFNNGDSNSIVGVA